MNDADLCRKNGWTPGTTLEGDDSAGLSRIVITAIGERRILARRTHHDGKAAEEGESMWTLRYRDWRRVS